ncbi:MAG TPA: VWA domain-containing protein [Gemmatimonadaceae bacterium]|nr:VWA domain-containing protein [Gemmatimonadaceae bacterium]
MPGPGTNPTEILQRTTELCRALRSRGVIATPAESVTAARALETVDVADRDDVYFGLRAVLTTRFDELVSFDAVFDEWWPKHLHGPPQIDVRRSPDRKPAEPKPSDGSGVAAAEAPLARWAAAAAAGREPSDDEAPVGIPMPSTRESPGKRDFATYGADDLTAVEQVAARIARQVSSRPSRRWRNARRGPRIDLRRVTRASLRTGGDPIELPRRERKRRRTGLVVLCDVSGSMDLYTRFLLQVLYALQHAFARIETFAFSTRLARISDALSRNEYRDALDRLADERDAGWSGGTRIGESLAGFVKDWSSLLNRRTVVLILSDGWDTGAPEVLSDALAVIHRRAGRVVWLNPLLGNRGYEPRTRGMQAALPHVDILAPGHNLESLERLGVMLRI